MMRNVDRCEEEGVESVSDKIVYGIRAATLLVSAYSIPHDGHRAGGGILLVRSNRYMVVKRRIAPPSRR